ncbi:hypothetical protein D8B26_002741 [Coccidioides posadasii str. Silveira]|uniref:Uncharacterized protein n=2 Tax=Coccidioides posadasii TaxID=199306 RepID=E9CYF6_COCPS|nr:hypothetical protein CPC735_024320 [Coccidioides posadasii C735 delta SOWgp]EER27096.1 hypothetical protein CPC735_024320 [Coccidioides posadasii C735 delta SOWgp]EFW20983.1 conserved hypothetical protein [Coccidioides posadasii str. Silveira]QVM08044.1 hypothetical protein D8B26_002741 [Coccidioides posadasii str. Silveira]|eukprot:XP_003069241.1 hypothetical protein CPC735_024320 [Coccidioides posadasii C735 delta SOWgp]
MDGSEWRLPQYYSALISTLETDSSQPNRCCTEESMGKGQTKSRYFPRKRPDLASCLPFPPTSAPSFGLIQETLALDPFRLLIATIFLNRTRGEAAIPVLYDVFENYPTIGSLADADVDGLVAMIRKLGFQNARANKCISIAKLWMVSPPVKGKRFRKLHYPDKSDGLDIKPGESIDDEDTRIAWEIAHLPGIGAYAIDSWRIFCRDVLRGVATDWNGANAEEGFLPEWKSVRPKDKELRAFLTWMWLKEGWVWNPDTGERTHATKRIRRAARRGGLVIEKNGNWILETPLLKKAKGCKKGNNTNLPIGISSEHRLRTEANI